VQGARDARTADRRFLALGVFLCQRVAADLLLSDRCGNVPSILDDYTVRLGAACLLRGFIDCRVAGRCSQAGALQRVGDLGMPHAQSQLDRVSPSLVTAMGSAPLRSNNSTIGRLPFIAA
jgi:hypothetical protein